MNDKDILVNAPEGATHFEGCFYLKHVKGDGFHCFHNSNWQNWDWKVHGKVRALADIKRIVELEACLIKIRELLAGQKDKSCLGTGYPSNENDCSPWPIVDEAVNNITQALKVGIKQ
jgi:hypothetical protein